MQIKCRRAFAPKAMLLVESRPASVLDARGQAGCIMFHGEKRAHGGRMRTYIRPVALLLRSTRIENFVGAHPLLMRAVMQAA